MKPKQNTNQPKPKYKYKNNLLQCSACSVTCLLILTQIVQSGISVFEIPCIYRVIRDMINASDSISNISPRIQYKDLFLPSSAETQS